MSAAVQLSALRRLRDAPLPHVLGAACDGCGEPLPAEHAHVADLAARRLQCVCARCRDLAVIRDGTSARRAIPRRYLRLPPATISDDDWNAFDIPVGIAFLFHNSTLGRSVASYPSPAGAVESLLPAAAWDNVLRTCSWTSTLVPDVEALLVRRTAEGSECFLVPIDACYALAGRIRRHWRGFGGGPEVEEEIARFFTELRERSVQVPA